MGRLDDLPEATQRIVEQPNDFSPPWRRGVDHASSIYGGEEFALAFGGNEMPGYHTGPAAHVGCLMGARHSHLDNAGYSVDQKVLVKGSSVPQALGDALLEEESWRQILSSIVICFFAREIYDGNTVLTCLKAAGFDLDEDRLLKIGRDIHREKFRFKTREGFTFEGLRIPERILKTKAPATGLSEEYIRAALNHVRKALA